jgi:hypothetical protein
MQHFLQGDPMHESKLKWTRLKEFPNSIALEALLGQEDDGVSFSLSFQENCHRRGRWRLLVDVLSGAHHHDWGCFDDQDQPTRYYHSGIVALAEAQTIADVLYAGRHDVALFGPSLLSDIHDTLNAAGVSVAI